ncbi:MAG: putative Ig domain-containing protein, partial [Gemmataceae bacterium]|nr:putative Ig domain-containing protein [Gemmataceae bacterium]
AYSASGLPSGVTIDPATGLIGGSADYTVASSGTTVQFTATVTVSDQWGAIDKQTLWLTVSDVPLVQNQYLGVYEGNSLSIYAGPSSPPSGIAYSSSALPAGLALNSATGLITGRPQHQINNPSPGGWTASTATVTANYGAITDVGTIVWTVSDVNRLPSPTSAYAYSEGQGVSIPFAATDLTGSTLTYTATGLPSGLTINSGTGLITGTVNFNAVTYGTGYPTATVTLTDNRGGTDYRSVNWAISDVPLFGWSSYWYGSEGNTVSLSLAPTAAVSGTTYTSSNLPAWLALDAATGKLTGYMQHVPNNPSDGGSYMTPSTTLSVTVTASVTGAGSDTLVVPMSVTDSNRLPSGSYRVYNEGVPITWSMAANNALANTLAYSASGLPSGVTIDPATGLIGGSADYSAASPGTTAQFTVTVTVSDQWGAIDKQTLWLTVSDVPIVGNASVAVSEGASVNYSSVVSNPPSAVAYTATGLPSGLTVNAATGAIQGRPEYQIDNPSPAGSSTHTATITATFSGMTDKATLVWTVSDTNRLPTPSGLPTDEGTSVTVNMAATDYINSTLAYTATGLPSGVTINPATGLIGGRIRYDAAWGATSIYYPTVRVADPLGGIDYRSFTWSISDVSLAVGGRRNDVQNSYLAPIAETSVDVNMGALRVRQDLDFDASPGRSLGGSPALVYNSTTASPRPIVEIQIPTDSGKTLPATIQVDWWFDGVQQTQRSISTAGYAAGNTILVGLQVSSAVAASGLYDWNAKVAINYVGASPVNTELVGALPVVSRTSSEFGSGWGISGVEKLLNTWGGVIWISGSGETWFFDRNSSGIYETPGEDFGTLTYNTSITATHAFAYTAGDKTQYLFKSIGTNEYALERVVDTHNLALRSYSYDTHGYLTSVLAIDGGATAIAYTGSLATTITEPGSRAVALSYTGTNLTGITDAAGSNRALAYDGSHRLTSDAWSPYQGSFSYSSAGLISGLDYGDGVTWDVVAAIGQGLATNGALASQLGKASITDALSHGTAYDLDIRGRLLKRTAADGTYETWSRGSSGLATSYVDAAGRSTAYSFNVYGFLASQTNPDGSGFSSTFDSTTRKVASTSVNGRGTTTFSYTSNGDLTSVVDALGNTTRYNWDSAGLMTQMIDASSASYGYAYDSSRRQTRVTSPLGFQTTTTYDSAGNFASVIDPLAHAAVTQFDKLNRLTYSADANGNGTNVTYLASGLVASTTNAAGSVSNVSYDRRGWITETVDAAGSGAQASNKRQYDVAGNATATIDPLNRTTTYEHDVANRVTKSVAPGGKTTTYQNDAVGNATKVVNALGKTTNFAYDGANRVTQTVDPLSITTGVVYDLAGALSQTISGKGLAAKTHYDVLGRITKVQDGGGRWTSFGYDSVGRVTKTTDGAGNSTTSYYDLDGRKTLEVSPLRLGTTLHYDSASRLTKSVDPLTLATSFFYDDGNRLTKTVTPGTRTETYGYDGMGRATSTTDAAGNASTNNFDKMGRLTETSTAGGLTTKFKFDAAGQLTQTVNAKNLATDYQYDGAGNQTKTIDAGGKTFAYEFDVLGRVTKTIDANLKASLSYYDDAGRVTETKSALSLSTKYRYDADDQVTETINAKSLSSYVFYDDSGLVTKTVASGSITEQYGFDALGRKTSTTNANGKSSLVKFDADGRLTETSSFGGKVEKYEFDAGGRITKTIDAATKSSYVQYDAEGLATKTIDAGGRTKTYEFDALGQITKTTDQGGKSSYTYFDKDGRVTKTKTATGLETKYAYDNLGNVTQTTNAANKSSSSEYDDSGYLTRTVDEAGKATAYALDAMGRVTSMTDAESKVTLRYFDDDGRLTESKSPLGYSTKYAYDAIGEVTKTTDAKGAFSYAEFDDAGRRTKTTDAAGKSTTFAFDPDGKLTATTNALGKTTTREYDDDGMQTKTTTPGSLETSSEY